MQNELERLQEIWDSGQITVLIEALLISTVSFFIANSLGFFRLPQNLELKHSLKFYQVLGAFIIFIFCQIVLLPLLFLLWISMREGHFILNGIHLDSIEQGWANVIGICLAFSTLLSFYGLQSKESRKLIWDREEEKGLLGDLKSLGRGVLSSMISYPAVFIIGQGVNLLLFVFFGVQEIEQIAVKSLKKTMGHPSLNVSIILCIACLVPVMEELLFRGFLQTWLRGKMGLFSSIGLTSLLFACFHFSSSQGMSNFEYITALFLLSCFLGYLYEKEKSLWASIGLHFAFNSMTISFISAS